MFVSEKPQPLPVLSAAATVTVVSPLELVVCAVAFRRVNGASSTEIVIVPAGVGLVLPLFPEAGSLVLLHELMPTAQIHTNRNIEIFFI